eukprot:7325743-Pyramimonas_sp.AAC.2
MQDIYLTPVYLRMRQQRLVRRQYIGACWRNALRPYFLRVTIMETNIQGYRGQVPHSRNGTTNAPTEFPLLKGAAGAVCARFEGRSGCAGYSLLYVLF